MRRKLRKSRGETSEFCIVPVVTKGDTKEVPEGDRCENAQGNRSGRLERKGSSARKRVPKVVAKRIPWDRSTTKKTVSKIITRALRKWL